MIINLHAGYLIALTQYIRDFVISQHLRTVLPRIQHIGGGQAERIHGAVRHFHRPQQRRVYRRFKTQCLLRGHHLSINTCCAAGFNKRGLVCHLIFRQCDKQAVGFLDTVAGNAPQNPVFRNTFPGGFRIRHRISGTAVQQAVVAAGRAGRDIKPLQQQGTQAAPGTVPRHPGTGCATADDNDIRFIDR